MRAITVAMALFVLASALGAQSSAQAPTAKGAPPARVVFVCEHGSVKSLIAASYFIRRARERGLAVRAVARGAAPDAQVPESVVQGLSAAGFEVSAYVPGLLKE